MKSVSEIIQRQQEFFDSQITLAIDFCIAKPKELKTAIKKIESDLISAFRKDLGKGEFEVVTSEVGLV